MVSGKRGTFYDEAVRVPLIVVDPTGRYTRQPEIMRAGVTSHVDLLRLLVTLGHAGSTNWLKGELETMYGGRHDMLARLRSPEAPGRAFVLHTCDEDASPALNFLQAPWHVSGMVTVEGKLGVYSNWRGSTGQWPTSPDSSSRTSSHSRPRRPSSSVAPSDARPSSGKERARNREGPFQTGTFSVTVIPEATSPVTVPSWLWNPSLNTMSRVNEVRCRFVALTP